MTLIITFSSRLHPPACSDPSTLVRWIVRRVRLRSLLLQCVGLVDRLTATLLALHEELGLVWGRLDVALRGVRVAGDLLLDRAFGGAAVAVPLDLVALAQLLVRHGSRVP